MRLDRNWKKIARTAWSIRFMVLAGLLTGLEVALPFFAEEFPRGIFAVLAILLTIAALLARLVAQKGLPG